MIDLSKYRVIDLSHDMIPGEQKIDGQYLHGEPFFGRGVEVQEFMAYGARMHFIQSQTHNGTHAEGAYKYLDEGPDMAGMPLEAFLGEAVVCDFSGKKSGEVVEPEDVDAGVSGEFLEGRWDMKNPAVPMKAARAALPKDPHSFPPIQELEGEEIRGAYEDPRTRSLPEEERPEIPFAKAPEDEVKMLGIVEAFDRGDMLEVFDVEEDGLALEQQCRFVCRG